MSTALITDVIGSPAVGKSITSPIDMPITLSKVYTPVVGEVLAVTLGTMSSPDLYKPW